jgi:formylglycine-generating enzyme required for sulfatase activity
MVKLGRISVYYMGHETEQDEASDSTWRATNLDARQTAGQEHGPNVQTSARNTNRGRGFKTKSHSGRRNCKERSEIEVRQRTEQRAETRRVEYPTGPFTGALGTGTGPQTPRPVWALLIRCMVVGAVVGSVSVWLANALPSPHEASIRASATEPAESIGPPASVVVPSAPEGRRTPEQDGSSMKCTSCPDFAGVPAGRLSSEAELLSSKRGRMLEPKEIFTDCNNCPEMVVVPAGKFIMGSPDGEQGHDPDESPRHSVAFGLQFAVGRFAVTFDEWDACVAEDGCDGYKPADHGWGRGRRPVTNVSWDDAKAYVAWLSKKTGKPYRLLSEAEREYITRAGTTSPFWWGSSMSTSQANYDGDFTYGDGSTGQYRGKTVVVELFSQNPWGLYQVHGNSYDWVEDCYHDSYRGAPSDGSAWISEDCGFHVARGGSWIDDPRSLRSAYKLRLPTATRFRNLGFRVGRTLSR